MSKKRTFRNVVLCHTNDFPPNKNDKIKGWVESHGGTFTKTLTSEVTHLVCSDDAWRRYLPIVREARRQRTTKVVNFEWLEDSLLSSSQKPKNTRAYDRERIWAQKKMKEQQQQRVDKDGVVAEACTQPQLLQLSAVNVDNQFPVIQHEIDVTEFEKDTKQSGYHLYTDEAHFRYSLTLVRTDILKNQNEYHRLKVRHSFRLANNTTNANTCPVPLYFFPKPQHPLSRHPVVEVKLPPHLDPSSGQCRARVPVPKPWAQTLQIFESDALPHRYWCLSKYSTKGKTGTHEVAPIGSQFDVAFAGFKKFFKAKTNVDWEARLEKRERCCQASDIGDGGCDDHFKYQPPGLGKQKGAMRRPTLSETWVKEGNASRRNLGDVTVVMPRVEVVEDEEIECSARTPEGGW